MITVLNMEMESNRSIVSKIGALFFGLLGFCSITLPLIITIIAIVRLSTANHGRPIFAWALQFYLVNILVGLTSLSGVVKIKRYAVLWMPAVGLALSGALTLLAFVFWILSGVNIQ